jgi:N-acetylglucosaminyldiphosphoundecaprenol N-acetyl-beta-D-mannosaminyltransferase
MSPARVRFGRVWVDAVDRGQALAAIEDLVAAQRGGAVYTPNVDHVVMADRLPDFAAAYARADLSLCDGQPLRWTSRLLGLSLPERVAGADVFLPLMRLAGRRGWRVYLLGGGPGVVERGAERLAREEGVTIAGVAAPRIGLAAGSDEDALVARIAATRPDLIVTCLGAPKGELWIDRVRDRLRPAVAIQLGASLDFYLGLVRRAPAWMQRVGLEWLHRLLQEPRRLAHRYLARGPGFALILARTMFAPRHERIQTGLPQGGGHPA